MTIRNQRGRQFNAGDTRSTVFDDKGKSGEVTSASAGDGKKFLAEDPTKKSKDARAADFAQNPNCPVFWL